MTIGILALDGLDYRVASDVGLFDPLPVDPRPLTNDLSAPGALFTPRVWTSVFAGADDHGVDGWLSSDAWDQQVQDDDLTFLWDRIPGTIVHDLAVHRDGHTTPAASMPTDWTAVTSSKPDLKARALDRADYWNQDVQIDPPVLAAWFRFPDGYGHKCVQRGGDLADGYRWMRDTLFEKLDVPDDLLVVSDHGFVQDTDAARIDANRGADAHRKHGVLATSKGLGMDDFDTISGFIAGWTDVLTSRLTENNLRALGYVD